MRTTPSPAATAGRSLARVLKAVLSLIVLAAAVAGLPLLLAWATPVIWASTHDDLAHLLDRQDTGAVVLLLLVVVGWIGWAQFTYCAVRELIAQLRGRTWQVPRTLGSSQRAAALLIGSILVLLPTSSALASDAQAAPATTASVVPGQVTKAPQVTEAEQNPASIASTSASRTSYTVHETRPAESLWGIAERELGDGERWREIASLNEGRTMADGQVFRSNSFLQPGWQLEMPDTAGAAGGVRTQMGDGAPAGGENSEHVVTVQPGDYLSKIAEEELGDGGEWPRLFEASQGQPQPGGLPAISDPDVIYAGQKVTVPGAQPDGPPKDRDQGDERARQETAPPAPQKPDAGQEPRDGTGEEQAPVPSQTTAPAPESTAPSAPASRPAQQPGQDQALPSAPSAPASVTPRPGVAPSAASPSTAESSGSGASSATTASEPPATAPASSPLNLRTVFGAGALLAAAITGALALRRTLQRRRRKPGETIAIAAETSSAEAQLAAAAESGGSARLDVALRTMARQLEGEAGLPGLRAARIGARSIEVLPEDLALEPLAPFAAGPDSWWVLPGGADLLDDEAAREVPAPYPGLVTLGSTADGDLLLVNLAQLPALLLDGDPTRITEVCTSLAVEIGMSPWGSEVEVVAVGFGEDLPRLLPTSRIMHMREAVHALRDLSERLLEVHQMPETSHLPYLLLCASSLDGDTAWQFADVIDKARIPVTLIAPASAAAAHFPDAEILNAELDEPQQLDYLGTEITVQRLERTAYQQIATALAVSGQPAAPAEGPWKEVPAEPEMTPPPAKAESDDQLTGASTRPARNASVTPAAPVTVHTSGGNSDVFPALLAASADPAGLRLLPSAPPGGQDDPEEDQALAEEPAENEAQEEPGVRLPEPDGGVGVEESEAHDLRAPEIRVLGPVEVDGVAASGHGPRIAQLASLLFFRPGRSADELCADMDPLAPWSSSTLNSRLRGLRGALGNDPAGDAYVPRRRTGDDPYRLSPAVRCDWTRFLQLAERALPQGPAGLQDLEKALGLVRGRPFGSRPLPWAGPYQQEMITRIIDVAHTVATHRTPAGPHHDLTAARQAVATGLEVDNSAELLYRDWMRVEHAAGNRSGLHTAITQVQQVNRSLDCDLEVETEHLINDLLHGTGSALRKAL